MPFQAHGRVHELPDDRVVLVSGPQFRLYLHGLLQSDRLPGIGRIDVRHELRYLVDLRVRYAHDAAHVAYDGLCLHRPEGDYLGDVVLGIFLDDVIDDLVPFFETEIDVYIGHRDPLGVEEPLEDEPVLERVDIGYAKGVTYYAARGRPPPRPDGNAFLLGVVYEIPDYQEVTDVPRVLYYLHLVADALFYLVRDPVVTFLYAIFDKAVQERRVVLPLRGLETRQVKFAEVEFKLTFLGDPHGVRDRLGHVGESRLHLFGGLEIHLVGLEFHPVLVVQRRLGLDAEKRVVRLGVAFFQIMDVVGGDKRQAEFRRELDHGGVEAVLLFYAVVLDLEVEVVASEDVGVFGRALFRLVPLFR